MKIPTISLNEFYGPTLQGEGPDIGRPCFFIRTQHCPVKCPGCDSGYTWNGKEEGDKTDFQELGNWLNTNWQKYPGAGVVLTGGEPLLHYRNTELLTLMDLYRQRSWSAIETSGFIGPKALTSDAAAELMAFLFSFSTVCLSPKITPCLHGDGWTNEELCANVMPFIQLAESRAFNLRKSKFAIKFVVKDEADFEAVMWFRKQFTGLGRFTQDNIYLMPYGIHAEEVAESCRNLVPILAKEGYTLSPRLHTLLWGNKRAI